MEVYKLREGSAPVKCTHEVMKPIPFIEGAEECVNCGEWILAIPLVGKAGHE
jgi:hypothetical protein